MTFLSLLIGGLIVWRISFALVKENGPLMVFTRIRAWLASSQKRSGGLFDAISCMSCTSVWVGLVVALLFSHEVLGWVVYALAFSAISMLLEILANRNALPLVTGPAGDDKVLVRGSSPSK